MLYASQRVRALLPAALVGLSLLGLANTVQFLRVTYGPDAMARLGDIIGEGLRHGPHGKGVGGTRDGWIFFGLLPNAVAAMPFYAAVVLLTGLAAFTGAGGWRWGLLVLTLVTLPLGVYLIYSLVVKLRALCPLCLRGHAINAALIVVTAAWALTR